MQNAGAAVKPWYRLCVRCGKKVFSDLLDSEGICDYCREVKSMKASVSRSKKGRKERK
jgi:DNA-directed RNA polymerase subunit RPC12/RpoP